MRFAIIVKSNAKAEAGVLPSEAELTAIGRFNAELLEAGVMLSGEGLHPSSQGTRVHIHGAKTTIVDGPFAESHELVAGFWVIRAGSKAEAIECAKRIPFQEGAVEIRQLFELDDYPIETHERPARVDAPPTGRKSGTRRYVSLLKADRHTEAGALPSEQLFTEMGALIEEMAAKGALLGGEGLFPSTQGARVVFDGDERVVQDGPFAETKVLVAGFMLYQTATKEEAVEYARRCLAIHLAGTGIASGEIEVRQVIEVEDFAVDPAEKPGGWREQAEERRARLG